MPTRNTASAQRLEMQERAGSNRRESGTLAPSTRRQTRAVILEKAVELASLQGLEQLSLGRLSSGVKMSKSGLYAHFGSKEELQLATIDEAWNIFEAQVLRHPKGERGGGPVALVERWFTFSERKVFPGGCLFSHQAVEFASRPGPVAEALTIAVARQIKAIAESLPNASKPGVRRDRDTRDLAFELYAIVINADALFRIQQDPAVFDRAKAAIRTICRAATKTGHGA